MNKNHYLKMFENIRENFSKEVASHKEKSLQSFLTNGFPSQKHEDWRYLKLDHMINLDFHLAEKQSVKPALPFEFKRNLLVFVDGYYFPEFSETCRLDQNLFSIHKSTHNLFTNNDAIFQMNNAFSQDHIKIEIKEKTQLNYPIYILNIMTSHEKNVMSHTAIHLLLETGSSAIMIEHDIGTSSHQQLSTHITYAQLKSHAKLTHYVLHETQENINLFNYFVTEQDQSSELKDYTFAISGQLFRQALTHHHKSDHTRTHCYGLIKTKQQEQTDIQLCINHTDNHGDSDTCYHAIADDHSRVNFQGIIEVSKNTKKNHAKLLNKNIPLSNTAQINTKPVLKIFSDEVNCSHGATIGKFDPEAIKFMNARGIETPYAKELMTQGFAREIIQKVEHPELRAYLMERFV